MKKLSKIYVTELPDSGKWVISFGRPEFQQKDNVHSMEVDESTAIEILKIQNEIDNLSIQSQEEIPQMEGTWKTLNNLLSTQPSQE